MSRQHLINVSLLIGSIVIFFFGIEFTLRITGLQTVKPNPPPIYQSSDDPRISYELIPSIKEKAFRSTVTTNSLGFRSPEIEGNKPLIAVLGDSITFGYGVEDDETLPARLQEHMPGYEFLNTAVPGYNLGQEYATYDTKIYTLDPEGLILVFYPNDLNGDEPAVLDERGNLQPPDWIPSDPQCDPIQQGILSTIPGSCWFDLHSAFYKAVKKFVNMQQAKQDLAEQREEAKEPTTKDLVTKEQLDAYKNRLDALVSIIPHEFPMHFVIWPDKFLYRESMPKIIKMAEDHGFVVINLYELFGNEARTLGWDTVHPHPDTIEGAAEYIAPYLKGEIKKTNDEDELPAIAQP